MTIVQPILAATAVYNDLYIRDSFSDKGAYPSSGDAYKSPDIIPFLAESLTWTKANSTYNGPDIGLPINNGGANNIYVRCYNLGVSAGTGTVALYYADASLFLRPSTWTQISSAGKATQLPFAYDGGASSIPPHAVGLSNPPFLLTNLRPGPHYCLIAVAQTPTHPVVVPQSFTSNAAFAQWVQNNPAVGWRNIAYAPNTATQAIGTYDFANINADSAYFHFQVIGSGFQVGTPVRVQCTDQKCPIDQKLTLPAPDAKGNQITGFDTLVPANFDGDVQVTITSPSGPFPPSASLSVGYFQYPSAQNELDVTCSHLYVIRRPSADFKEALGQAPIAAQLIKIGECTIRIAPAK